MKVNIARDLAVFVAEAAGNGIEGDTLRCKDRCMSMTESVRAYLTAQRCLAPFFQVLLICFILDALTIQAHEQRVAVGLAFRCFALLFLDRLQLPQALHN